MEYFISTTEIGIFMKLIIDNSNLFDGGGLQVAMSFVNDLRELGLEHSYYIVNSPNAAKIFEKEKYPENFYFTTLPEAGHGNIFKRGRRLRNIEKKLKPDVIFTVFGPSYHKSRQVKVVGFAIPYIVYPDSPFLSLISIKEKIRYKLLSLLKSYCFKSFSDALIFETEDAKQIFVSNHQYKKQTFTVGNTLNEIFFKPLKWKELEINTNSSLKILFLTANYPHKNMKILPEVIQILIDKYKIKDFCFLITLDKNDLNFSEQTNKYITYLGKIELEKIPSLYKKSNIVFIPTLLEVFSATYLEAMFMKKPIIASDMGFSRDICRESAYFCNPIDPEEYAKAIYELASNESLRNKLVNNGTENLKRFGTSMDRTQKYLEIIKEYANQK